MVQHRDRGPFISRETLAAQARTRCVAANKPWIEAKWGRVPERSEGGRGRLGSLNREDEVGCGP